MRIVGINRQNRDYAKKLGYPLDFIGTKKPKHSVKIRTTDSFTRYALGNKNILVAKKGVKLKYI